MLLGLRVILVGTLRLRKETGCHCGRDRGPAVLLRFATSSLLSKSGLHFGNSRRGSCEPADGPFTYTDSLTIQRERFFSVINKTDVKPYHGGFCF